MSLRFQRRHPGSSGTPVHLTQQDWACRGCWEQGAPSTAPREYVLEQRRPNVRPPWAALEEVSWAPHQVHSQEPQLVAKEKESEWERSLSV